MHDRTMQIIMNTISLIYVFFVHSMFIDNIGSWFELLFPHSVYKIFFTPTTVFSIERSLLYFVFLRGHDKLVVVI